MDAKDIGRRAGWSLAGAAFLILALEAGFRLSGAAVRLARWAGPGAPGVRTVLCEGDSFTYGIGGRGFPSQLEELLAGRAGGPYRVVNMGVPGLNTGLLADVFESHLEVYRPDVVLVVAGEDNYWNSVRLETLGRGLGWTFAADRLLLRSRVYKFLKIAGIGLRRSGLHREDPGGAEEPARRRAAIPEVDAFIEAQAAEAQGDCGRALPLYRRYAAANSDDAAGALGVAHCLLSSGRPEEAAVEFERATRAPRSPAVEMAHHELGWVWWSREPDKALAAWRRGLAAFPGSRALSQDVARALGKAPEPPPSGGPSELEAISVGFRTDIRRVCAAAKARGVPVVFGSYPDAAHPEVYETAREMGEGFVDFRELFKKRFKSRAEYLSSDYCHCNTAGYGAMAEAFAEEVVRAVSKRQRSAGRLVQ